MESKLDWNFLRLSGKFIYITTQEMINVADFMKQRGRVSMMELAKQNNKLIDLEEVELKLDDDDENEEEEKVEGDVKGEKA